MCQVLNRSNENRQSVPGEFRGMDDARQLIEDKQREIEDNALDLLDAAAGGEVDSAIGGADAPDSALPEIDKTATSFDPAN